MAPARFEADIDVLRDVAGERGDVRALLHDLAVMCRALVAYGARDLRKVAEDGPEWKAGRAPGGQAPR